MDSNSAATPGAVPTTKRQGGIFDLLGRIGISVLFLDAARYHLTAVGWDKTLADMTARGVPLAVPALLVAMATSICLALALLLNIRACWAALGLSLYTICVSSVMYTPFAGLGQMSLILFLKDLCIAGALLSLSSNLTDTGWRPSLVTHR